MGSLIFHWLKPSGHTRASNINGRWAENAAGAYGWQPYNLDVQIV